MRQETSSPIQASSTHFSLPDTFSNDSLARPENSNLIGLDGGISAPAAQPPKTAKEGLPKIVFVVMSAVSPAEIVDQLAHALAPHQVLVHHDFSQTPTFHLTAPNVVFVPQPKRTGWAVFGFVEGIFHALDYALQHLDFDYLQLLSPSCLPVKPLAEFERHIGGSAEAHFDCIDLRKDRDALMSVGYRAFTAEDSLLYRAARRLTPIYFGPASRPRHEAGIWLHSGRAKGLLPLLAHGLVKVLGMRSIDRRARAQALPLYYGSVWFGARRHIVAGMVDGMARPGVRRYFSRVRIAEEFLIPSLLMRLHPRKGPMNHFICEFKETHPGILGLPHLSQLHSTPAFFARKFSNDLSSPARVAVLAELSSAATESACA